MPEMKRRTFLQTTPLGLAGLSLSTAGAPNKLSEKGDTFQLNFAPHLGMFKAHAGADPLDQIRFMYDQGFRAFEDNGMPNRTPDLQQQMGDLLERLGMQMGVFVPHKIYWNEPNLANGDADKRAEFLEYIRQSVEIAKRCRAKWMTVVPGHLDLRQDMGYQTAHVVESLRRAAEILEPHGLVMVLEPLNFQDHPGLFLSKAAQAYQICRAVNSPSCKILFDIYHQQITEGNLLPNIEACWDEIAYFQIGDNPGRNEPTTGEINYANIFKYIHQRGFNGVLGMEHGNAQDGKAGELAVISAYRSVDPT